MSTASTKTSINPSQLKSTSSQGKKPVGKGKIAKPADKGKKCVVISTSSPVATTSTVSLPKPNLRNKLWDKAKVTGNDSGTNRRPTIYRTGIFSQRTGIRSYPRK